MFQQLSLGLRLRDDAKFSNFYAKNNEQVVQALHELIAGTGEQFIYLWGSPSSGRTHLLHSVCAYASERYLKTLYIPLTEHQQYHAGIVDELETSTDIVCIDDIDRIAGNSGWEQALFHFYNRARENNTKLIITGNLPPVQLPVKLLDLKSRLSWGLCFHVHSLMDEEKLAALQLRAQCRGLKLSDAVGRFLINRYARDMAALFDVLELLDSRAFVAQRGLTIPFVKEVLGL
jgi:DnaA family protein